jgi:hypothetical protein
MLDNVPVATLLTIAAIVGGIIALISGDINYPELLIGIGATTAGSGVLGEARNRAGKGLRRNG